MSSLALASPHCISTFSSKNNSFVSSQTPNSISLANTQLKHNTRSYQIRKTRVGGGGLGIVCYSSPLSPLTLQSVSTISSAVLLLSKGTAIPKSFLVPMFALQAPATVVSWIKGEYGTWTAFLALAVRLFFHIPAELELPFMALLLVIVSPYQVMDLRSTQAGAAISLIIAGYLAFQHFTRLGSLRKGFEQGSAIATLGIISVTAASCLLLI